MDLLGAGSDNAVFAQHLGIPTLYVDFTASFGEATYHSAYDRLVTNPTFLNFVRESQSITAYQYLTLDIDFFGRNLNSIYDSSSIQPSYYLIETTYQLDNLVFGEIH